jgi:type IV pilus assembly protein PilP
MTKRRQIFVVFMAGVISLTVLWSCDSKKEPPPKATVVKKKIQKPSSSKARRKVAAKTKRPQMDPKSDIALAAPKQTTARTAPSTKPAVKSSPAKNSAVGTPATAAKSPATGTRSSDTTVATLAPKSDIAPAAKSKPNPTDTAVAEPNAVAAEDSDSAPGPKAKTGPQQIAALSKNKAQRTSKTKAKTAKKSADKLNNKEQPAPYDPTGKINPFEPLFKEKPKPMEKVRKKRVPRTPLEKIALSQLKLVGIILANSGNRALVQESSGKGYIIKKGTYIGLNAGKVTEILKDTVVIEEEVVNVLGKVSKNKKQLKLPKPPGE